ncbi:MAG: DUF5916 domain-containing protein [Gemmatimonadota bacterium]|nr:DUF5916 domain-containing protein [Gemmatimonadota bacterium]
MMWTRCRVVTVVGLAMACSSVEAAAFQDGPTNGVGDGAETASPSALRTLQAAPVTDQTIEIDGRADEAAWQSAEVATEFVQLAPREGAPASQRTEARVLYGDRSLYVHMKAFEPRPEEIVGQLTRRDQRSHSDLLGVAIDSYHDRRTAFQFSVNPVGVKHDVYHFDDTSEDSGWDAVWDVATEVSDDGWSAEFRIPYSQLRFRDESTQTWGINFVREIARNQEMALWSPTPRSANALVSRFGELRGIRELDTPSRLELLPYTLGGLERAPGDPENPFHRPNDPLGQVGANLKYGLTPDLTLDVTLNPDFGQVEADPAQVNLSAFETFLPERRPFFVEGSSIFNFSLGIGDGDGANESLFYSRRIGRAPQGSVEANDAFSEADDRTSIYGAWKLSGKTAGGWSIGALHALTSEESARVAPEQGARYEEPVEPLTNYGVLRIQKDFREGRSAIGMIGTGTRRDGATAEALKLRSEAYSGGLDFRHRFADERWELSGYVLGSHVRGSPDAIARTQRSPARYFQRPDAEHVTFDPERTTLTGAAADLSISKVAGGYWRFATGLQTRSPGFEVNDLGFMNSADYLTHWGWLGYHHNAPQGPFRRWSLNLTAWNNWNYEGAGTGTGGNVNANVQFQNFWNAWAGVNSNLETLDAGTLRGGPMFRREAQTNFWGGFGTDGRKPVQLNVNGSGNVRPASDSWALNLSPNVRIRPSDRATFNLGTFVNRRVDDRQWVGKIETDAPHYLFGRLHQTTIGVTVRADYAFTPTVSLQLYAQPFVSAGRYGDFKTVANPRAERYADRFEPLAPRRDGRTYYADLDRDATEESFDDPDFNVRRFRSNAVLRWEFRPGSTLFLVWSQGRDDSAGLGDFDLSRDLGNLFGVAPRDVFMVKLSYWLGR